MSSLEIFIENIDRIAEYSNAESYREISIILNVTEDALKHWKNKTRCPSLKQIDRIADHLKCYTYSLIQKEGDVFANIDKIKNNSHQNLLNNLKIYFSKTGKTSWTERTALFYGFVSEDALKSYFRKHNFTTPPLKRLDEMAEAIGLPAYQLIKELTDNEKTN